MSKVKVGSKDQQQVGSWRSWEADLQLVAKIMAVCKWNDSPALWWQIVTYTLSGILRNYGAILILASIAKFKLCFQRIHEAPKVIHMIQYQHMDFDQ
jgi:hypothetical protein